MYDDGRERSWSVAVSLSVLCSMKGLRKCIDMVHRISSDHTVYISAYIKSCIHATMVPIMSCPTHLCAVTLGVLSEFHCVMVESRE